MKITGRAASKLSTVMAGSSCARGPTTGEVAMPGGWRLRSSASVSSTSSGFSAMYFSTVT